MEIERWRELASEYIEGTLPDDTATAVRAHLDASPESRAEEAHLRGLFAGLRDFPEVEPPLFFADNVMARLAREQKEKRPWWASLSNLGRTAGATLALGGLATAVAWMYWGPRPTERANNVHQARTTLLPGLHRGAQNPGSPVAALVPQVSVERSLHVVAGEPLSYDFALRLENAERGSAHVSVPGDSQSYKGVFAPGTYPVINIPLSAARDPQTLLVRCEWNADGQKHVKQLVVPLPEREGAGEEKQSFGLAELPLPELARALSARYGRPITLEDVPDGLRVAVTARTETLEETLTRHLRGTGLRMTSSAAGVLIAPAAAP